MQRSIFIRINANVACIKINLMQKIAKSCKLTHQLSLYSKIKTHLEIGKLDALKFFASPKIDDVDL